MNLISPGLFTNTRRNDFLHHHFLIWFSSSSSLIIYTCSHYLQIIDDHGWIYWNDLFGINLTTQENHVFPRTTSSWAFFHSGKFQDIFQAWLSLGLEKIWASFGISHSFSLLISENWRVYTVESETLLLLLAGSSPSSHDSILTKSDVFQNQ